MTKEPITPPYDDEYSGPRWTYGLTHRPLWNGGVPKGYIILSNRTHPDFIFGTIDYQEQLTNDLVQSYQLTETKRTNL